MHSRSPGTSRHLELPAPIYLFPDQERKIWRGTCRRRVGGQGEGGKGWKSMPELISGIDNFAKGLTAPIHRSGARRGCPRHWGLPEGRPQPS